MCKEHIEREATCMDCLHYEVCADPCTKYRYRVPCRKFVNAADVVEVQHGKWMRTARPPKSRDGYYYWNKPLETVFVCSECGRVERVEEPYCHCGAKMDGKGDE